MGAITCSISDETEKRLRQYLWNKYHGKGRHLGPEVEAALKEYLDLHEDEVKPEEE